MTALACKADPRFRPSRLEAPAGETSPHYSVDTVRRVTDQLVSGEKLFFITGSDAFAEVTLWYKWREVAATVEFIVVSRPGTDFGLAEAPKGIRAHWLEESSCRFLRPRFGSGCARAPRPMSYCLQRSPSMFRGMASTGRSSTELGEASVREPPAAAGTSKSACRYCCLSATVRQALRHSCAFSSTIRQRRVYCERNHARDRFSGGGPVGSRGSSDAAACGG